MWLFIAEGDSGQYDDWDHWTLGVFTTRAKAKAACESTLKLKQQIRWCYDAKRGESHALVKFSAYESGSWRVLGIEVDQVMT